MLEPIPPTAHAEVRYEKSDARGGIIIALGGLLVVVGLVVLVSADWLFDYLKAGEDQKYRPLSSLAAKQRAQLPRDLDKIPEPRLQESEPPDLAKIRKEEDSRLNSYGWVEREKGIVHIPIDDAMRLFAERSFKETKK